MGVVILSVRVLLSMMFLGWVFDVLRGFIVGVVGFTAIVVVLNAVVFDGVNVLDEIVFW